MNAQPRYINRPCPTINPPYKFCVWDKETNQHVAFALSEDTAERWASQLNKYGYIEEPA